MVIKTKQYGKNFREGANQFGGPSRKDFNVVQPKQAVNRSKRLEVVVRVAEEEAVDVIDLGAPRRLRCATPLAPPPPPPLRSYTPNPRLYPGPASKPKRRPRRPEARAAHTRRLVFRRPVPNARLYRPAPRRAPPPSRPRAPWPPPAPPARALDTASRAALRLAARPPPPAPPPPPPPRSRRLVVTLPAAGGAMDAARHSTSPDDCSDADALSAPSEFLAEFLSAIMQRQYAEALKYCRLILQYEPHNATARGFYPLLRHKVQALKKKEDATLEVAAGAGSRRGSSSSSSAYSPAQRSHSHSHSDSRSPSRSHQRTSGSSRSASAAGAGPGPAGASGASGAAAGAWAGSSGSVASQSSLELDSCSGAGSGSGGGSPARDANGNPPPPPPPRRRSDDLKNDNDVSNLKSESSSSLRRLRAQFACSIK